MTRLLNSSIVLVFAGEDLSGNVLSDMYSLHIEKAEWRRIVYADGPGPSPRLLHTATAISSTAMVVMGGDAIDQSDRDQKESTPAPTNDVWVFDIRDFSWREIKSNGPVFPPVCSCHSAVFGTGIGQVPALYIFGGFSTGDASGSTVMRLRICDWKWERLPVLVKGTDGKTVSLEDPTSLPPKKDGERVEVPQYPTARESHAAVWLPSMNGMLLVGGDGGAAMLNDCWLFVPSSRKKGAWKWRHLKLSMARGLTKNKLPLCAGHSVLTLTTEKTQVIVWGGITGYQADTLMASDTCYLIDLDSMQTSSVTISGKVPSTGRLLHGVVRFDDRLIVFGGCDGAGKVLAGVESGILHPSLKSGGQQAMDFGPIAADVAAGRERPVDDIEMKGMDKTNGVNTKGNLSRKYMPLMGPSTIPKGTPLSGRILDVSDIGYFVSVVISGNMYKGVLVANPLKKGGGDKPREKEVKDVKREEQLGNGCPPTKKARLEPMAAALPDSPQREVSEENEVIDLD